MVLEVLSLPPLLFGCEKPRILRLLQSSGVFASLPPSALESMLHFARREVFRLGQRLFAGVESEVYVMVLKGRVGEFSIEKRKVEAGGIANFGQFDRSKDYNLFPHSKYQFSNDLEIDHSGRKGFLALKEHRTFEIGYDFGVKALYTGSQSDRVGGRSERLLGGEAGRLGLSEGRVLLAQSAETVCFVIEKAQAVRLPVEVQAMLNENIEKLVKRIELVSSADSQ